LPGAEAGRAGPHCWALLACAGRGVRAASAQTSAPARPKQYQSLAGTPLVLHTLAAFAAVARVRHTLVVLAPHDGFWQAASRSVPCPERTRHSAVACGGATRAQSVHNGLQALRKLGAAAQDWVLVHDAARCLITPALINTLIDACENDPVGGLLALPVSDTLSAATQDPQARPRATATVARSDKWLAQTPQMFRLGALSNALHHAGADATDEASAMQALGQHPLLVRGSAHNVKVTWPEDFALAAALLALRGQPGVPAA